MHQDEELNKFQEKIWSVLVLQFLLAFAGNGYAIYCFMARKHTWHTGTVYCFNLAVSDLLYAFSLLPLAAYYYPPKHWTYGIFFCKLDRFLFFCNLYSSTFFVACIGLNRYVAIVHPFFAHGRIEPHHAKLLSGAVWLLTVTISAPIFHFTNLKVSGNSTNSTYYCLGSASEGDLKRYWPYSLFLSGFGCGLPFIATLFSCVAIVCTVVQNRNISGEEKYKVNVLVSAVVVLYALFYLPFHVLRNLNLHHRIYHIEHSNLLIHTAYQLTKILVNFHICIHPFVYAALANSMQEYCCRGIKRQKDTRERKSEQLRMCNRDFQDRS